jgi:cysteine synthase A
VTLLCDGGERYINTYYSDEWVTAAGLDLAPYEAVVREFLAAGETGSVVTLLCDGGERYANTYYSDEWVREAGLDLGPSAAVVREFLASGTWPES